MNNFSFVKKRLQHRYFPVLIEMFLRTPISKNICERLLLSLSHIQIFYSFSLANPFRANTLLLLCCQFINHHSPTFSGLFIAFSAWCYFIFKRLSPGIRLLAIETFIPKFHCKILKSKFVKSECQII